MMDAFRIKHVVNEVKAKLREHEALPNFEHHARKLCREVVVLLRDGREGYKTLNITANNYQALRTNAQLAERAVLCAASRWNVDRWSRSGDAADFVLDMHEMSRFVHDKMTDYEDYFLAYPERVAAFADRYQDVEDILDANVDEDEDQEEEAEDEDDDEEEEGEPDRPYESAPLPLANGRIGCGWCNKTMADMEVLETHHRVYHKGEGKAACTECTWTKNNRASDVIDHQHCAHDIYEAGDARAFSTNPNHLKRKAQPLLARLYAEDSATLDVLRGLPPAQALVPAGWGRDELARQVSQKRLRIIQQPGWQALVDQKRADRVAQ